MNVRTRLNMVIVFAIGLLLVVGFQIKAGWWLDSGRRVAAMMAWQFAIAALVAFWESRAPWRLATALSVGSVVGMAATLFWIGPGTIWPIVLVVAAILTTAAVFAGTAVTNAIRRRRS